MANLQNLKPFQKGHKKLGGRKKGVRNRDSNPFARVFIDGAERLGSDGKGTDGLVGFFMPLLENPKAAVRLFAEILKYEAKHPPRDLARRELERILYSSQLTEDEKLTVTRIWQKVTID